MHGEPGVRRRLSSAVPGTSSRPSASRNNGYGTVYLIIALANGNNIDPTTTGGTIISTSPLTSLNFIRGDVDSDGVFNGLLDSLFLLNHVFLPGTLAPTCLESADVDGDGLVNGLEDAMYALSCQFAGGPCPPGPFPDCDLDPDAANSLGCEEGCD